jgi:hypothetical protein
MPGLLLLCFIACQGSSSLVASDVHMYRERDVRQGQQQKAHSFARILAIQEYQVAPRPQHECNDCLSGIISNE